MPGCARSGNSEEDWIYDDGSSKRLDGTGEAEGACSSLTHSLCALYQLLYIISRFRCHSYVAFRADDDDAAPAAAGSQYSVNASRMMPR